MLASIDDIKEKLTTAASTCVSGPEAAYFAELGIDTHLRKAPRMNPLQEAIDDIKKWRSLEGSRFKQLRAGAVFCCWISTVFRRPRALPLSGCRGTEATPKSTGAWQAEASKSMKS